MMKDKYTLDNLPLEHSAVISSIECKDCLINRIYDMGILKDTVITPLYRSPFGDPTASLDCSNSHEIDRRFLFVCTKFVCN